MVCVVGQISDWGAGDIPIDRIEQPAAYIATASVFPDHRNKIFSPARCFPQDITATVHLIGVELFTVILTTVPSFIGIKMQSIAGKPREGVTSKEPSQIATHSGGSLVFSIHFGVASHR